MVGPNGGRLRALEAIFFYILTLCHDKTIFPPPPNPPRVPLAIVRSQWGKNIQLHERKLDSYEHNF